MAYQDGNFPLGAPVLTNALGNTFKCNSFSVTPTAETTNIQDEMGEHSGAIQYSGPITFQAELQYANANIPELVPASVNATIGVFVNVNIVGYDGSSGPHNCFITDATTAKPQRGPWTATVTGQVRKNP